MVLLLVDTSRRSASTRVGTHTWPGTHVSKAFKSSAWRLRMRIHQARRRAKNSGEMLLLSRTSPATRICKTMIFPRIIIMWLRDERRRPYRKARKGEERELASYNWDHKTSNSRQTCQKHDLPSISNSSTRLQRRGEDREASRRLSERWRDYLEL